MPVSQLAVPRPWCHKVRTLISLSPAPYESAESNQCPVITTEKLKAAPYWQCQLSVGLFPDVLLSSGVLSRQCSWSVDSSPWVIQLTSAFLFTWMYLMTDRLRRRGSLPLSPNPGPGGCLPWRTTCSSIPVCDTAGPVVCINKHV